VQAANTIPAALQPIVIGGVALQWLGTLVEAEPDT
jgi:hypothetical protein